MPSQPKSKNTETALIKLNGTLIKSDGTETPSNYFTFLDLNPDDYSDIVLTVKEASAIKTHLQHLVTGATAAVPLWCGGSAVCPFSKSCPYIKTDQLRKKEYEEKKQALIQNGGVEFEGIDLLDLESPKPVTPVGRKCLVEVSLLNEWTKLYIQEYEINPHNFTEFQMVRELAEVELLLWRLNNNIAKPENAELTQNTIVGFDKQTSEPLTRTEVSSIFEAKERLSNRKSKLIKLMVGDRQEKYKKEAATKSVTDSDPSISAAKLRGKIDKLLSQARDLDTKIKEAEGKIIDVTPTADRQLDSSTLSPEDLINSK